jgi:hypothetical protein
MAAHLIWSSTAESAGSLPDPAGRPAEALSDADGGHPPGIASSRRSSVSMFRKTVLATAIVGAGLGSLSGAAFAGDCPSEGGHSSGHHHASSGQTESSSCTNNVAAKNATDAGDFADVLGGAQTIVPVNVCHVLDQNELLNDNHLSVL